MKRLQSLRKYFIRYRGRFLLGILFATASSYFAVKSPQIVRDVLNEVQATLSSYSRLKGSAKANDVLAKIGSLVLWSGLTLLGYAILRGVFMFFMRQTFIVMSRHIEYDQKAEIFRHYEALDTQFFKTHFTGDMMNRISEDVSRVRQYSGPAIMYAMSLAATATLCIWGMLHVSPRLTLYVMAPLPFLALTIYIVNRLINRKSEGIQAQLSDLTTTAQESYSGIRVIKSFVQEEASVRHFNEASEEYRKSSINLALTEAVYFPSMNMFTGLSMLSTVFIGGMYVLHGQATVGNIAEFVMYINLLMFPISSLGVIASTVQRASVSQRRIDEFLDMKPIILNRESAIVKDVRGDVDFQDVTFTYPHTGITALRHFSLAIKPGEKVAVIGKTGSGKSTLAHLLLRMYDVSDGAVMIDGTRAEDRDLTSLRAGIAYTPQDPFLFSDTIWNNIAFGCEAATDAEVREAARLADLDKDIATLADGYDTIIGERGVMLSGGQKQRLVLARALMKKSKLLILDESLSAVDTRTEQTILNNLRASLKDTTVIVITHRIFTTWTFDKIVVLDNGSIIEAGTHEALMRGEARYAKLYRHQTEASA